MNYESRVVVASWTPRRTEPLRTPSSSAFPHVTALWKTATVFAQPIYGGAKGGTTMGYLRFFLDRQFGGGAVKLGNKKIGVIAETAITARRKNNLTIEAASKRRQHRIGTGDGDDANVCRWVSVLWQLL